MSDPAPSTEIFEIEGFLWNLEGEQVGFVSPEGERLFYGPTVMLASGEAQKQPWIPSNWEDLEYLLRKRQALEARIVGEEAAYHTAIVQMQKSVARNKNFLARFDFVWEKVLVRLAQQHLPPLSKTYYSPHGRVVFRSSPAAVHVEDPALAMKWAREKAPEAVVQKPAPPPEFHISKLNKVIKQLLLLMTPDELKETGLKVKPADETYKIDSILEN